MTARGRFALVAAAVAVVVAAGFVALHIATRPVAEPTYSHAHLVWAHRTVTGTYIGSVAFSPDGNTLAVAGRVGQGGDNDIELWNVPGRHLTATLPCADGFVTATAFSPDGRVLAVADTCPGNPVVQLWDMTTDRLITALSAGPDTFLGKYTFLALAFSPDGHILAAGGSGNGQLDGAPIVFWNMDSHQIVGRLFTPDPLLNVDGIAFSPDGRTLVSTTTGGDGPAYNAVQLWDTTGYRLVGTLSHQQALSVRFGPDGHTVAVADLGGSVQLWDVTSHQLVRSLIPNPAGGSGIFEATAFTPDGRVVAAGDTAGILTLWDAGSGRIITTLSCHCAADGLGLLTVAFSPHGDLVAAAGNDDSADIWSAG